MIPQKIQIKNFLSYGPVLQTIDFAHHSLICLSGKNGHGKSALLDAMTWAVWGQARKVSGVVKADQGLLRLGQTQMLVVFDFMFGGKTYRIRREYMETYGKPVNTLEFGILNTDTDTLIPLTDKTIRTTQEKIQQTLGIDFDSFSNSAFLKQGSSNEFSKKSPKERKQILATILGLDQYETIRKLALEKTKDAQNKKTILATLQEKRMEELSGQDNLNEKLTQLNAQMAELLTKEQTLNRALNGYKQEQKIYSEKQQELHNLLFQLSQLTEKAEEYKKQLREKFSQWRNINKKRQSLHTLSQLEQEKNKVVNAIAQHQKLLQENLEQKHQLLTTQQKIHAIEQEHKEAQTKQLHSLQLELERTKAEHKNHEQNKTNILATIKQLNNETATIDEQIEKAEKEHAAIQIKPEEVTRAESLLEKHKAHYQQFVSLGNWISAELNSLSQKKKLVHEDDPSCPLCEQNLSASRRKFLKANFDKQESFLSHRLLRLKRIIPIIKERLISDHTQLKKNKELILTAAALTNKIKELSETSTKITQQSLMAEQALQQAQKQSDAAIQLVAEKEKSIAQSSEQAIAINSPDYLALKQEKLNLEQTLNKNSYSEKSYKEDQTLLADIEKKLSDYQNLQQDVAQQENRKNDITHLCAQLKQIKFSLHSLEDKKNSLGDLRLAHDDLLYKEKQLTAEQQNLSKEREELVHIKGSIENQQNHLNKIKIEHEREQTTIAQLQNTIDDYQTIATATGKDGIQALLIEEAIPEIEQEANYLLARLTNNQAQIFIESLRDLKKGGTKETLDIKISDQAGIRPYELFSEAKHFVSILHSALPYQNYLHAALVPHYNCLSLMKDLAHKMKKALAISWMHCIKFRMIFQKLSSYPICPA